MYFINFTIRRVFFVKKLKTFLYAIVDSGKNGWVMLMFFASMFLIENPWFGKGHFKEVTDGTGMLDMNFMNTPGEILNHLQIIGETGREAYLILLLLDFIIIVSFFLLQSTFIVRLLKKASLNYLFEWLMILPITRAVCDVVENVAMMANTNLFPEVMAPLLTLTTVATITKWISFWGIIATLLSLMLLNLYRVLRKKMA